MTMRVHKWPVAVNNLPTSIGGGFVLHVGMDGYYQVCVWTLEGSDTNLVRTVMIVSTGDILPDNWKYLGTAVMANRLVWHVFEVPEENEQ